MVILQEVGRWGLSRLVFFRAMIVLNVTFPFVQWVTILVAPEIRPFEAAAYYLPAFGIFFWSATFVSDWAKRNVLLWVRAGSYTYVASMIYWQYINDFSLVLSHPYILGFLVGSMLQDNARQIRYYYIVLGVLFFVAACLAQRTALPLWYFVAVHWFGYYLTATFLIRSLKNVEELRASQHLAEARSVDLERLLDSFSAMVCYKDRYNRITHVNQAYADFLGQPKTFFQGVYLHSLLPKALAETYFLEDKRIFDTKQPEFNFVEQIQLPDGAIRWVRSDKRPLLDPYGNVEGIVIYSVDITPQKAAEEQLRESEARWRGIFDKSPVGMVFTDAQLNLIQANGALLKMLGLATGALTPERISELLFHEKERSLDWFHEWAAAGGRELFTKNIRFVHEGKELILVSELIVFEGPGGQPAFVLGILQDITEGHHWEEQQKGYAKRLEDINRELEDFAHAASHDLREPLRTITSYVQLLRRRQEDKLDSEGLEFMRFIEKAAQRMNTQILGLLNYSRTGKEDSARTWLRTDLVLAELLEILHFQIVEAGAEITVSPLPDVYMVEEHLRALFQNLIGNGLKYRSERPVHIRIWAETLADDAVRFWVADNGIGIAPEFYERIFALFRRLHRQDEVEGAGIGLSICKKIVQLYGGQIGVESKLGEGSSFWFTLPKSAEAEAQ